MTKIRPWLPPVIALLWVGGLELACDQPSQGVLWAAFATLSVAQGALEGREPLAPRSTAHRIARLRLRDPYFLILRGDRAGARQRLASLPANRRQFLQRELDAPPPAAKPAAADAEPDEP